MFSTVAPAFLISFTPLLISLNQKKIRKKKRKQKNKQKLKTKLYLVSNFFL